MGMNISISNKINIVIVSIIISFLIIGWLHTGPLTNVFFYIIDSVLALFNILLVYFSFKPIISYLKSLHVDVTRLADGNFGSGFSTSAGGEVGEIIRELERLSINLKTSLSEFKTLTQTIAQETETMNSSADLMKRESIEQTKTVSNTAASIAELSASITEIAQSAEHIRNSAVQTTEIAENGGKAVVSMVDGMNKITDRIQEVDTKLRALVESNKKIGSIITVITEIAEQTNLLALNAAIEAARAGEQGRGFAVVADEVRMLAERSQKSAAEVVDLIEQTNQQSEEAVKTMREGETEVQVGAELSSNAGKSLKEIISHIKDVSTIIADVSSAVNEQVKVAESITSSMEHVNEASNKFLQSSEEVSKGSGMLKDSTEKLIFSVRDFNIED